MVLGVDKLLSLVKEVNLVENLCERELTNPEGTGFDLRIGELFTISGEGYLGEAERKTCDITSVAKYEEGKVNTFVVNPGDFFLFKTIEKVNIPDNLVAEFKPRSTMQRMGLMFRSALGGPGYSGELTFAFANVGPCKVKLEMGARLCHVVFHEVNGATHLYRGQWQGGRVTTDGQEVQV